MDPREIRELTTISLRKSISISILNFRLFSEEGDLHNIYRYANIKSKRELTDLKELHFIELPKFKKDKPRYLRTRFEKWLHVLKFGEHYAFDSGKVPEVLRNEEEMMMAMREMKKASSDRMVREMMEVCEKALLDEATLRIEGEREAMERGIAQGIKQGRQEGRVEQAREIAIRMRERGSDALTIADLTGLSVDEIAKLTS
ncbi:MAG: Rpn family recombination-promoting nuclease/putative transposase [Candidatus Eremiobacteraeota bacterium]|nr:Rpn family recombination-promoting nuclease/putative transposase [Candidatus Eremiobacteraeota bacterium]